MWTLTYVCPQGHKIMAFLGTAIEMPTGNRLSELLVDAEACHRCKPPPPIEDPDRTPY